MMKLRVGNMGQKQTASKECMARHHLNGQPCCSFNDPGKLRDNDLELVLVEKYPGDATIGYARIV